MSTYRGPSAVTVRGAKVNNLRDVDVDVPLWEFVGITGVSGSGKSSLALGVLYAEGSRRYLDGLSTYQRRRIEQAEAPDVREIRDIPAALALRQRPAPPGPRATVATLSEIGAVLRLSMSRLGSHACPRGHLVATTTAAWMTETMHCDIDGLDFPLPGAEHFAATTLGACPVCGGTGTVTAVDRAAVVPDESLSLDENAVAPWRTTGRRHMPLVARELGVRTDVPYRDLTDAEKAIVMDGEPQKVPIVITTPSGKAFPMDAQYESAMRSAQTAGTSARNASRGKNPARFATALPCPACHGSGLNAVARASRLRGRSLPELFELPLTGLRAFADELRDGVQADTGTEAERATVPSVVQAPAAQLAARLRAAVDPLLALGLGYLASGRHGDTLSTGERQRIELAATAMRQTTGMLYVLDEPTVGLHPAAVDGLIGIMRSIVARGNALVVVDHDVAVLRAAATLIEMGPGAGQHGGTIVATGAPGALASNPHSVIGPYLARATSPVVRVRHDPGADWLGVTVGELFTLHDVTARFPRGRLSVVTGVSGSGKSTLVVDALAPALRAAVAGDRMPGAVTMLDAPGVRRLIVSDSTPIGANSRSTPATYAKIFDRIRAAFADTTEARARGWDAGWFSFNVAAGGRCPTCEGLGELSLDLQYMPDYVMPCGTCRGRRYTDETLAVTVDGRSIADVLALTVDEALDVWSGDAATTRSLRALSDVGLGYLTLGEPTPALSGGEAQRLRLSTELSKKHAADVFIFDEPTIGLHPRDTATLVGVFDRLVRAGATVIVIEHDLDLIANADWVIDMGPGGGDDGGRIVSQGTVAHVASDAASTIGPYLRAHLIASNADDRV